MNYYLIFLSETFVLEENVIYLEMNFNEFILKWRYGEKTSHFGGARRACYKDLKDYLGLKKQIV